MAIVKEQEIKNTLKVKGRLVGIDDDGLHIEDEKDKTVDTIDLSQFKIFNGKTINLSVSESTKSEIVDDDNEEKEE